MERKINKKKVQKTFKIPDTFYKYGKPYISNYDKGDNMGLTFKEGGEQAFELTSAFGGDIDNQYTTVHILSPYVLGFNTMKLEKELISIDIDKKEVIVLIEE